jgi:hypothetical protein
MDSMMRKSKLLLVALTATALLGAMVSSASARNLSVDEQSFRITWTSLELVDPFFGIGVRCPVTLEGSFHYRTIVKTLRSLIGLVTRAIVNNAGCAAGHATVLTETLPWHVTYEGFTGTLPNITSLITLLAEPAFRIEQSGINCLARARNIRGTISLIREAGGALKAERLTPGSESIPCGSINGTFRGAGAITKLGTTARPLVRLI